MLFADELSGWGAAAVGALLTAVLTGLGALVVKVYRARGGYAKETAEATVIVSRDERTARREDEAAAERQESAILKEYKTLVAEQKNDRVEDRKLIHRLRNDVQTLSNKLSVCELSKARAEARAEERIAALEEALDEAGIPHRKWDRDAPDGSGPHHPLPPEGEPQ